MNLTPQKIYEKLINNHLDKKSSIDLLISIIENSNDEQLRLDSIDVLNKISVKDEKIFKIFENLLVSDTNPELRNSALNYLFINHQERVLMPIKWAIKHETTYKCLVALIKTLAKVENSASKKILIEELKKIRKVKYLNIERRYENKKFKKGLKRILKTSNLETLSHSQISEIIVNFLTVKHLSEKFPNVYFEINPKSLQVEELDLSDYLEYEVKGTPWGWKNNISNISEIEGLSLLKNLKKLDLSNNQIEDIDKLKDLKLLTHLIISNNKLKDLNNLHAIQSLPHLEFVDLCGNEIVNHIKKSEFKPEIKVVLKRYFVERFE
ncbi:MAG: leucine-rich repeat domain-containing protein [Candidatus Hermodarchaeota archaeon]